MSHFVSTSLIRASTAAQAISRPSSTTSALARSRPRRARHPAAQALHSTALVGSATDSCRVCPGERQQLQPAMDSSNQLLDQPLAEHLTGRPPPRPDLSYRSVACQPEKQRRIHNHAVCRVLRDRLGQRPVTLQRRERPRTGWHTQRKCLGPLRPVSAAFVRRHAKRDTLRSEQLSDLHRSSRKVTTDHRWNTNSKSKGNKMCGR